MEHWLGNGGYAEFMHIPSQRFLVPLKGINPVEAAPLADAGVTPYRAIKKVLPARVGVASFCLVIGPLLVVEVPQDRSGEPAALLR
jgi:propanol-preferring alcohol dehydrogenase